MTKLYTHNGCDFQWIGGLNVCLPNKFVPLKLKLNNGSPSWRLNRKVWLSVKQLKVLIKK